MCGEDVDAHEYGMLMHMHTDACTGTGKDTDRNTQEEAGRQIDIHRVCKTESHGACPPPPTNTPPTHKHTHGSTCRSVSAERQNRAPCRIPPHAPTPPHTSQQVPPSP